MNYKILVGISYEAPGQPNEYHGPGETAALEGWPAEDLERFEREHIIERVDTPDPLTVVPRPRKVLPTAKEE